eukprot:8426903-Pyramimonas_sp.AAC.1
MGEGGMGVGLRDCRMAVRGRPPVPLKRSVFPVVSALPIFRSFLPTRLKHLSAASEGGHEKEKAFQKAAGLLRSSPAF